MTRLTNPFTGHSLESSDEDLEFWAAAGYRADGKTGASKAPAKKAAAKKTAAKKSE